MHHLTLAAPAVAISELTPETLTEEFLTTLSSLAEVLLDLEDARSILRERIARCMRTYVAGAGEEGIIGTASLLLEPKFIHRGGIVGHIEDVAVRSDFRGAGIGRQLIEHASRMAQALGCYKVILNCSPENAAFYGKCGFREHELGMRMDLPALGE